MARRPSHARAEKIALILLDASMPGMDGYEVLRRLKSDEATANIGVIFVTSQTEEESEERGLLLGAADYIAKPIRPLLLKARVRNHLRFAQQREELERLSQEDGLTGIANRRNFDRALDKALRRAARFGEPLGLGLIDVDHFKLYNDHYGHGAGDEALRQVAGVLASVARRPYDLAARYGGEEFVLLLPDCHDIGTVLQDACSAVAALKLPHVTSPTAPCLTISCGGLAATPTTETSQALLALCDKALYEAKRAGRNRCVIFAP